MADHGHVVPVKTYLQVYFALIALLIITVVAAYIPLGAMNVPVAMAIAIVKATLVVLIFMNVKWSSRLAWLWSAIGFIWLLLLFTIITEYIARSWSPVEGWIK